MKSDLLNGSRSRILAGIIFVVATIFVFRLFYLQVIQHDYYVGLANEEQIKKERLPANRGEIYALNGNTPVHLVMNETVYLVYVDPEEVDKPEEVSKVMKEIAGGNVRKGFETLLKKEKSRYQIIADRVTRVQAEKIKEKKLHGVGFQPVSQRVYPEGQLAAQVLGFVNAEGKGNYGVEGYLNKELSGVDGRLETVKDVSNIPLTVGDRNIRTPAQNGKDLVLSIDRNVQSYVEEAIVKGAERTGATNISVLVMNPNNGQVLSMANMPSYNPAEYYKVQDGALFNNATISAPYEPGSDIKTFTMATAIDKGVARASDTFYNTDSIKIEDRVVTNATKGITGTITFQTALAMSLNTGFVTLAQKLGNGSAITRQARDTMYEYFHGRFGLGELTNVELSGENRGIIFSPAEQEGNAVRYSNMSFGQGLNATMVQVVGGFVSMINGGTFYKPTVIAGEMKSGVYTPKLKPEIIRSGILKQGTSEQMRTMMETARRSVRQNDPGGYAVGGKTGTSQVVLEGGGYSTTETIATYLGYGGGDRPEYVIMVSVSGKDMIMSGAQDAGPIFTDISNWMIDYLKIQPKG